MQREAVNVGSAPPVQGGKRLAIAAHDPRDQLLVRRILDSGHSMPGLTPASDIQFGREKSSRGCITVSVMKLMARTAFLVLLSVAAAVRAQEPAKVEPLHFHHVHLNSMDPAAAAAYYPKPFALSATKTTFNGFEAVKTGNIYILFTKVSTPPTNELTGPQTSVWHFGWNTPNSRQYNEKFRAMGLDDRADVGRGRRQARGHVERHAAGVSDAGADPRAAREGHAADARRRIRLSARP